MEKHTVNSERTTNMLCMRILRLVQYRNNNNWRFDIPVTLYVDFPEIPIIMYAFLSFLFAIIRTGVLISSLLPCMKIFLKSKLLFMHFCPFFKTRYNKCMINYDFRIYSNNSANAVDSLLFVKYKYSWILKQ